MIVEPGVMVPVGRLSTLFVSIFIAGLLLTFTLYKFDWQRFMRSSVFIKILFWWPIFALFVASLYLVPAGKILVITVILAMAAREYHRYTSRSTLALSSVYLLVYSIALSHFVVYDLVLSKEATDLLITICFSSVLSDVLAYFFGNFIGRHKLPKSFNARKSWEGVAGQLVGACLGVWLIRQFVIPDTSLLLLLPIGFGSTLGDLMNSYVKRSINIKDWGNSIPGHGGFLDRFSSLSMSLMLSYYWISVGL